VLNVFKSSKSLKIEEISLELTKYIKVNYQELFLLFRKSETKSIISQYVKDICILSTISLKYLNSNSEINRNKVMNYIKDKNYKFVFGNYIISNTIDLFIENF
jgi:hypothetical protein